jgi:hypothetical protein
MDYCSSSSKNILSSETPKQETYFYSRKQETVAFTELDTVLQYCIMGEVTNTGGKGQGGSDPHTSNNKQNTIQQVSTTTTVDDEQNNHIKCKDRRIAGLFDIFMMSKFLYDPNKCVPFKISAY